MSESSKKLLQAAAGAAGGEALAIEDVFSTYLYTGNGSTQTITNGIDLAGEGGLVWVKNRIGSFGDYRQNVFIDTLRGGSNYLLSNSTQAQAVFPSFGRIFAFNNNGFGTSQPADETHVSWTFRKAPRFFDVVTYTGNGNGSASQTLSHSLGSVPGFIIVKTRSVSTDWACYHASLGVDKHLKLNTTDAVVTQGGFFPSTPTSSTFTVGQDYRTNWTGVEYVAYLFAHDPLGPSEDGSDGLIACGSYTGNGSTDGPEIDLGWEPQWLLIKNASLGTENWVIFDVMRGLVVGEGDKYLRPNLSDAESAATTAISPQPNGFKLAGASGEWNGNGNTMIYIAIRRGPMRAPTSGTEVFAPVARTGTGSPVTVSTSLQSTDSVLTLKREGGNYNPFVNRLTGSGRYLTPVDTVAEITQSETVQFDVNDAVKWPASTAFGGSGNFSGNSYVNYLFRRAPGFFDVVAYSGNSVAGRTVPHNLGVAPEMGIFKVRNNSQYNWNVYLASLGTSNGVTVNSNNASSGGLGGLLFNNTAPTSSEITLGDWAAINAAGNNYIAYLFATLPGVSKVGSYTGNGSSQTINCGFTSGARFILIKRTDSTGDWYVWDTARGIVTGNDPFLKLNTTDAEVTSDDSIDPNSSGFIVNQTATTNVNVSSASYIFLAIA